MQVQNLIAEVLAAQQCADRGLLKFIFVSSDDAFISHMLGRHAFYHVSSVCLSCLFLSLSSCSIFCTSWTSHCMPGGV